MRLVYSENANFIPLLSHLFFNVDISVTMGVMDLKCSVYVPRVLLEGNASHFVNLGLSFDFMSKNG